MYGLPSRSWDSGGHRGGVQDVEGRKSRRWGPGRACASVVVRGNVQDTSGSVGLAWGHVRRQGGVDRLGSAVVAAAQGMARTGEAWGQPGGNHVLHGVSVGLEHALASWGVFGTVGGSARSCRVWLMHGVCRMGQVASGEDAACPAEARCIAVGSGICGAALEHSLGARVHRFTLGNMELVGGTSGVAVALRPRLGHIGEGRGGAVRHGGMAWMWLGRRGAREQGWWPGGHGKRARPRCDMHHHTSSMGVHSECAW